MIIAMVQSIKGFLGILGNSILPVSGLLDKKMKSYIKTHKNTFVVFYKGTAEFYESFGEAVNKGLENFGEEKGFVVGEVSNRTPVLSTLVRL